VRHYLLILVVAVMGISISGCSTNRKPRFDNRGNEPEAFRRHTGRPTQDYIFRWGSKAFNRVEGDFHYVESDDVLDVLRRHGQPDYYRNNVHAVRNEIFDEWVWWDRNIIAQFIEGQLVYEGDLKDSDRMLVTWGYPNRAYSQQYEVGPRREIWIWQKTFEIGFREASFTDGELVYQVSY